MLRFCEGIQLFRKDLIHAFLNPAVGDAVLLLGSRHGMNVGRRKFSVAACARTQIANQLVQEFYGSTPQHSRICDVTHYRCNPLLSIAAHEFGHQSYKIFCHLPCVGWATHEILAGAPFSEVQERRRWSRSASLRIHLDAASSMAAAS